MCFPLSRLLKTTRRRDTRKNESHSLTPTIVVCVLKQMSLDEHVMCIFYYRLKLYITPRIRMWLCVKRLSEKVCEREREIELECELVYKAVFETKNTFNVVGKLEIKTKHTP